MALEDLICEHEAVSEAAVTAIPDEKYGERPLAFVVLKEGYRETVDEAALQAFLLARVQEGGMPRRGVPDKIAIVNTIPTTSVGKISKKQLLRQHTSSFNLEDGP
jgi:fatty-acyl-CoA synthase